MHAGTAEHSPEAGVCATSRGGLFIDGIPNCNPRLLLLGGSLRLEPVRWLPPARPS